MVSVYIGLGSNAELPVEQVARAITGLDELPSTRLIAYSSLYRTAPVGPPNQPDYINAAALLKTALPPLTLLTRLAELERKHGRVRVQRWGRRTLDLDILLYGQVRVNKPNLVIPHPLLHRRAFVLIPLYEINPELVIPGKGRLKALVTGIKTKDVNKI